MLTYSNEYQITTTDTRVRFLTPTSDPSVTVTPESSPTLSSPRYRGETCVETAIQMMQNLSASDSRTRCGSGSTTPTTILEDRHETTAENEEQKRVQSW